MNGRACSIAREPLLPPRRADSPIIVARSERELEAAASHVGYELVQLAAMPAALRRADDAGQPHIRNACLESMFLHARNLTEFLTETSWASDVQLSEFAPKWSPPNSLARRRLRDARPMLDRYVSHLSWARVESGTPDHYPERIAEDVVEVMGAFVAHLEMDANPAAYWFEGHLQQARALLEADRAHGPDLYSTSRTSEHVVAEQDQNVPTANSLVDLTLAELIPRVRAFAEGALSHLARVVRALPGPWRRDGA